MKSGFSASSGDIPLGQYKLRGGSLATTPSLNDLQSTYQQELPRTFTSETDPSQTIDAELSSTFYYDGHMSDPSSI